MKDKKEERSRVPLHTCTQRHTDLDFGSQYKYSADARWFTGSSNKRDGSGRKNDVLEYAEAFELLFGASKDCRL
jgi:hypothetical protein